MDSVWIETILLVGMQDVDWDWVARVCSLVQEPKMLVVVLSALSKIKLWS